MEKKITKNKDIGKGLISLTTIIIVLISMLAGNIYYENSITANVIKELTNSNPSISIKEVDNINELNRLNEGWYEIRNGYVFYLEHFDYAVPLYIKVKNPEQQNGLVVVDEDGNVIIKKFNNEVVEFFSEEVETFSDKNQISGNAIGMEKVSGFVILRTAFGLEANVCIFKLGGRCVKENDVVYNKDGEEFKAHQSFWTWPPYKGVLIDYKGDKIDPTVPPVFGGLSRDYYSGLPPFVQINGGKLVRLSEGDTVSREEEGNRIIYSVRLDDQGYYYLGSDAGKPITFENYRSGVIIAGDSTDKQFRFTEVRHEGASLNVVKPPLELAQASSLAASQSASSSSASTTLQAPKGSPPTPQTFTFKVIGQDKKVVEESISIRSNAKSDALKKIQDAYQEPFYKIEDTSAQPSKSGVQTREVGINQKKTLLTYYGNYIGTYDGSSEDLNNVKAELDRLENLRKNNPNLKSDGDLLNVYLKTNQYQNENIAKQIAQQLGIQIPTPTQTKTSEQNLQLPEQLKGFDDKLINAWRLTDGKIIYAKSEYDSIVQKQFADNALKHQKLTSLNKIDEQDRLLAKDPKDGTIKYFDTSTRKYETITTKTYTTKETIVKDDNTINVFRTFETGTGKQTKIEVKKGETSATVDEDTVKRIKEVQGVGVGIVKDDKIPRVATHTRDNKYYECRDSWCHSIDSNGRGGTEITDKTGYDGMQTIPQIIEFRGKNNELIERHTFSKREVVDLDTKTTEKFGTLYYHNGYEITKEEYDRLSKEEKEVNKLKKLEETTIFKVTEEKKEGELKYLTTSQYDTIFDDTQQPIRTYEDITIDQQNGEMIRFVYGNAQGNKIVFEDPDGIDAFDIVSVGGLITSGKESLSAEAIAEAITHIRQAISRQFFANVERIFTEFRGLGYYATLFFDEDSLLVWRDNVDRGFATLYLGAEYWSSAICSNYLDGEDGGIAYAETPQGLAQVGAHIEATRTEPIIDENGKRAFIYKITFNVRNGDYGKDPRAPEEMNINVVLKGEKTAKVFKQDIKIKRGSSFGKTGSNAIVQDSATLFTKVCLTFDDVPLRWKLDDDELCNTIVESSGAPTPLTKTAQPSTTASSQAPKESEVNDF